MAGGREEVPGYIDTGLLYTADGGFPDTDRQIGRRQAQVPTHNHEHNGWLHSHSLLLSSVFLSLSLFLYL